MAGTITTIVKAIFQSQGAEKVTSDLQKVGKAGEEISKKQTRLGNESTNTGRAFASQASGLGGLVAAYAGAAATTFALQQAFSALKSAADFQQVISGTNALAASFGLSGSAIINKIQDITKGQLSLKEAATAANLALTAGFNPTQINKLTDVATKASKTLGRDLTDSYNRLVRGAAKLEPELLDELGIFTRIEPALEAYSARTGKAVNSLTNFERRQAFVNAIIDEGSRKYSEISLDTDTTSEAFNRLAASIVNVGNQLGGILADILAPIANFFSKNLGNSVLLFLGILTLALSKGKTLLETFFNNLSKKALDTGATVSSALTGPAFTTNIEKAGEALKGIGIGLTKAEMATVNAIKSGAVQPQQIQARIDELRNIQERQQNRQFSLGLSGRALDQSIAKANAATIAIRELEEAQKKASNSSIVAGTAFERASNTFSKFAAGAGTALNYLNGFLIALGAVQLVAGFFGVDILGSITEYFTKLREESRAATEAIGNLVTEVSKISLKELKFTYKKEEIQEAANSVAEILKNAVERVEIVNRQGQATEGTISQGISAAIAQRESLFGSRISQSARNIRDIELQLLRELQQQPLTKELGMIATQAPGRVGGQAADYIKLFTGGELKGGALEFNGVLTQIVDKTREGERNIYKFNELSANIALNIGLGVVEIKKFNQENAKGLLTAESASQRNLALQERIREVESQIANAYFKVGENSNQAERRLGIEQLKNLETQRQGLIVEQKRVDTIATELGERERLRKLVNQQFSSQIKLAQSLPVSGIFNPDQTIARDQNEIQRNQVLFLGKQSQEIKGRLVSEEEGLLIAKETLSIRQSELSGLRKLAAEQGKTKELAGQIATAKRIEQEAADAVNIAESKVSQTRADQRDYIEAQIGALKQAGDQAFQLTTQEEKRTLEYRKQLDTLINQREQIDIQNKISLAQASGEAAQRTGQAQIRVLESQITLIKEQDAAVQSVLKSKQVDYELDVARVEQAKKLADSQAELAKARFELSTARTLAPIQITQESIARTPDLVGRETLLKLEQQIAEANYVKELALIQDRKAIAEREFTAAEKTIKLQQEQALDELAAFEARRNLLADQRVLEDDVIKKRDQLEKQKIQNELKVLGLQDELSRSRARAELQNAYNNKLQRDFELDQVGRQLDLLEQQKTVFTAFLEDYKNQLDRILGVGSELSSTKIFKNFDEDLKAARRNLTENRKLSESAYTQEASNAIARAKGEIETNAVRKGAAAEELKRLQEIQDNLAEARLQQKLNADIESEAERRKLQDNIDRLKSESAIASQRYNTAITQAAKDELLAAQSYASKLQELADQRDSVKQLFQEISKGIKDNLSSAVQDFFKTLNNGLPILLAFKQGIQKLGLSVLETIQMSIAKVFIIQPLQDLVGQGIGFLYKELTGKDLAKTGDQILQSVFTGSALRVTMEGATPGAPAPGQGGTTGFQPGDPQGPQVAAQAQQKAAEASEGFGDKLKTLGVNFQTVGAVAIGTFGAVLAATGNWKKAFLATILTTFSTMITQIIMKSSLAGVGSAFSAAGSGISGFFGNLFGSGASAASNNPLVNPELSPQIAIGGPVRHMAAGGYAGLRDRVPALLEPGEFVIRRPAAMAIGGDTLNQMNATGQTGPGNVTVNMNNQGTPQEVIGTPKVSMNGRDMIVDIVVKDIQNNGPIRKTLRGGM